MPRRRAALQPAAAGGAQAIELRGAVVLRESPLRLDEPLPLEAVQGGVERALADDQRRIRGLLDPLDDAIAVAWSPGERLEDQQVEGAAHQADVEIGHRGLRAGGLSPSMGADPSPHKGSRLVASP